MKYFQQTWLSYRLWRLQSWLPCRCLQLHRNAFTSKSKTPHFSQHAWENELSKAPPHVFLFCFVFCYACYDKWNNPLYIYRPLFAPAPGTYSALFSWAAPLPCLSPWSQTQRKKTHLKTCAHSFSVKLKANLDRENSSIWITCRIAWDYSQVFNTSHRIIIRLVGDGNLEIFITWEAVPEI